LFVSDNIFFLRFSGFSDREYSWTPTNGGTLLTLASHVNYDKTSSAEPVLLNLGNRYYVHYNLAESYNSGTEGKANQVVVTEQASAGTNSLAGIDVGGLYVISNFQGTQDLHVKVCRKQSGSSGIDIMVVSVALDKDVCNGAVAVQSSEAAVSSSSSSGGGGGTGTSDSVPPPLQTSSGDQSGYWQKFLAWLKLEIAKRELQN
jgi:hypothetical protein